MQQKKIIFIAALGGGLEFYDFIIYVYVAQTLGQLFFPADDPFISLIASLSVFALSYLARPLGGILFSHFGDTRGRKQTFTVSVILMAVPTVLIGCLPTYADWGIAAPLLLVMLRLIQGFAVGGEIPGAITFTIEQVTANNRAFACAAIFATFNLGLILGQGLISLLQVTLSNQHYTQWGWRIAFYCGGVLGLIGLYMRKKLTETPVFAAYKQSLVQREMPLINILKNHSDAIIKGLLITWICAVQVYLLFIFMPNYLLQANFFEYSSHTIHFINALGLIFYSLLIFLAGWLCDKIGIYKILTIGIIGLFLFSYLSYSLLALGTLSGLLSSTLIYSIFAASVTAPLPVILANLFPTGVRYTGIGLTYNLGYAIFGGTAPLIATYLIKMTGNAISPAFYLMISAVGSLIGVVMINRSTQTSNILIADKPN